MPKNNRPQFKPGELVYFRFRATVGAVLPYMPDKETLQVLIVGAPETSIYKIGEVINTRAENLMHFFVPEGIHLLPP